MAGDIVSQTNQGMLKYFTSLNVLNLVGWIVFIVLIVGAVAGYFIWNKNKKLYSKKTTDFEIVGINFIPTIRDTARTVKLGSGGFEILYLKKLKTWRLCYGGRVGKDTYYFFRMPDGYPYNAMLSANLYKIDELKGLIPVVTTNASMRSQYTSLEKQIDALHKNKVNFLEKYGAWLFAIGFLVIAGVMLYLNYQQFVKAMSSLGGTADKFSQIADKLSSMAGNIRGAEGAGGLQPA